MNVSKKIKGPLEIICILAAITAVGIADETLENVQPGATTVDLGDGYEISLELDDLFEAYDIEIVDPSTDVIDKYELVIREVDSLENLMDIWIYVFHWEELYPVDYMPDKIDDSFGSVTSGTYQAEFEYLPDGVVTPDGKDIKYTVEVHGQMSDWDSGIEDELPVFELIVDSIHVSGPGI